MPYVIQLFFDAEAENKVAELQRAIGTDEAMGRPHLSLASSLDLDVDRVPPLLDEIARTSPRLSLVFAGVGSFLSDEGTVYLSPAPSTSLLSMQQRAMHVIRLHGSRINAFYMADIWVPHCTIANGLDIEERSSVLRACCEGFDAFPAKVHSIGLVEYGDGIGRELCEYPVHRSSGRILQIDANKDLTGRQVTAMRRPFNRILGIDHAQITVPAGAENAARVFYSGILDLPEIDKPESLAGRGGFWLQVGDRQVHIGTEPDFDRTLTKSHLAYAVIDLDGWRTILSGQGIEILDGVPIPGYNRFEFRDPFGNRVEMIEAVIK